MAPRCPLCRASEHHIVFTIGYRAIWDALEAEWGAPISPSTREASATDERTTLLRCGSCGLEWFDPASPGGPAFYAELMGAMPYNADRWEFGVARAEIRPDDDVLDLGCGEGAFLRSLGNRSGRTVGVDLNAPAVDALRSIGIEAHVGGFGDLSDRAVGLFDVVSAFHLLEHVADPLAVVRAAGHRLKPEGRMIVSVPNRERSLKNEREPLDCPPHHVTRWSADQLNALALQADLSVRRIIFEPPDLSVARELVRRSAYERMRWLPERTRGGAIRVWGRFAMSSNRHRRLSRGTRFAAKGMFGHAVLVEMARRSRPAGMRAALPHRGSTIP